MTGNGSGVGDCPGGNATDFDSPGGAAPTAAYLAPLFVIGAIGTALNAAVVAGVCGNAKLGTTINRWMIQISKSTTCRNPDFFLLPSDTFVCMLRLLIWICCFASTESTAGLAVKGVIIGERECFWRG